MTGGGENGITAGRDRARAGLPSIRRWICYYGLEAAPDCYTGADLVVFGSRWHPPLIRSGGGPVYLGYASIGEVDGQGEWWSEAAGAPFLVKQNRRWGSWIVDVRSRAWQALFVERIVAQVLDEGFDGIFCDTLDAALSLAAWNDADTFAALRQALVGILKAVRRRWPERMLVVNRGLAILDETAPLVDALVVEGLYSVHDAARNAYCRVDAETRRLLLEALARGRAVRPDLPVLTLDYAPGADHPLARAAVASACGRGFVPSVGTVTLDRLQETVESERWKIDGQGRVGARGN